MNIQDLVAPKSADTVELKLKTDIDAMEVVYIEDEPTHLLLKTGEDGVQHLMSAADLGVDLTDPESLSGYRYYQVLTKLIQSATSSDNKNANKAGAITLQKFRNASGDVDDFVTVGAYLCSNDEMRQVFLCASLKCKTTDKFAQEYNIDYDYAEDLIKKCSVFGKK